MSSLFASCFSATIKTYPIRARATIICSDGVNCSGFVEKDVEIAEHDFMEIYLDTPHWSWKKPYCITTNYSIKFDVFSRASSLDFKIRFRVFAVSDAPTTGEIQTEEISRRSKDVLKRYKLAIWLEPKDVIPPGAQRVFLIMRILCGDCPCNIYHEERKEVYLCDDELYTFEFVTPEWSRHEEGTYLPASYSVCFLAYHTSTNKHDLFLNFNKVENGRKISIGDSDNVVGERYGVEVFIAKVPKRKSIVRS